MLTCIYNCLRSQTLYYILKSARVPYAQLSHRGNSQALDQKWCRKRTRNDSDLPRPDWTERRILNCHMFIVVGLYSPPQFLILLLFEMVQPTNYLLFNCLRGP